MSERPAPYTDSLARFAALIHTLRGQRVMLSHDLAALYGVETKVLLQAVRRNAPRFPSDFMFCLTREEVARLRSQIVTSSWGGHRYLPYAFTEQGIAMLSSVLRSEQAVQVNIAIMRAFVHMRALLEEHVDLRKRLDALEAKYDGQFAAVFDAIRALMDTPTSPHHPIGFAEPTP